MPPELPPGSRCKTEGCGATIHWTKTRLGKGVPLEPTPNPQGAWVVDQDPAMGPVASKFSPMAHGGMTRYRSHLERCHPNGRGPAAPAPKPDATAGLAFPRRADQVGPFPPLKVLAPAVLLAVSFLASTARAEEDKDCGSERWGVKTATDGAQLRFAAPPEVRTVAQLIALPAPKYREGRPREGAELDVVALVVFLRAVKLEEDGDLHVLISDTVDGPTMVAEIPDPNCAVKSPYKDRMSAARGAIAKLVGAVFGKKFRTLTKPPRIRMVGPIFFDKLHGQTGMAANGVEIHPVLDVEADDAP